MVQIEEEHARRLGREARFDLLPQRLLQDAMLQELFWDYPDIRPAPISGSLLRPRLRERYDDLSSGWPWGALKRLLNSILKRTA